MTEEPMILPWPEWQIAELLGQGTFGKVYRIQKTEYGHTAQAALKIITCTLDEQEKIRLEARGIPQDVYLRELREKISSEIDIMQSLKGAANIVSIEDWKIEERKNGWILYIRMELLKSLLQQMGEKCFTETEVRKIGTDLCTALSACSRKGVIHRDIKPDNIFVSEFGDYKLGDFGISRYLEHTLDGSTKAGAVFYMAPEICRGEKYGKTVDIYSLGVVLYQLANTGRFPFLPPKPSVITAGEEQEADKKRLHGAPFPDPFVGGSALGQILRKACSFRPADRYQTPDEMRLALEGKRTEEKKTEPESNLYRTVVVNQKETNLPDVTEKAGRRKRKGWIIAGAVCIAAVAAAGILWITDMPARVTDSIQSLAEKFQDKTGEDSSENDKEQTQDSEELEEESSSDEVSADGSLSVEQPSQTVSSGRIWEDNGTIYTVYDIRQEGYVSISGDYVDTMIFSDGRIYWRKTTEEGKKQCPIISMNPDGSDQKILTEISHPSSVLCIYNGYLYYTSLDEQGNKGSRRINLENGQDEEAPLYMFRMGNDQVWISTSLTDGKLYSSAPGFENPVFLEAVDGTLLDVVGTKLYYMWQDKDSTYITASYDCSTGEKDIILRNQPSKSIVSGSGLYFKNVADGNTVLHRIDLTDGMRTDYDLGDFHLYMGGGFYEVGDTLYIMRFVPENELNNAELWTFSRQTGEKALIGQWYNSNAENAAKEP